MPKKEKQTSKNKQTNYTGTEDLHKIVVIK